MGPLALHGGAEFGPHDDPFLIAVLRAAHAKESRRQDEPCRIVIVPTAARRERPTAAVATGTAAIQRVAAVVDVDIAVEAAMILDEGGAGSAELADLLRAADLIYFTGGDPDIIPSVFAGSRAWDAVLEAGEQGAVLVGASAGAMAMAAWAWTPNGGIIGLGLVAGLIVLPHFERVRLYDWRERLALVAPQGLGFLGLDEQTGLLSSSRRTAEGTEWDVVGAGGAHWFPPGAMEGVDAQTGEVLVLPG